MTLLNIYFQGFSPESQIHAFFDGLSKRMFTLADKDDEISKENYRQRNDEVDPSVWFLRCVTCVSVSSPILLPGPDLLSPPPPSRPQGSPSISRDTPSGGSGIIGTWLVGVSIVMIS